MNVLAESVLQGDTELVSISFHCAILLANNTQLLLSAVRSCSTKADTLIYELMNHSLLRTIPSLFLTLLELSICVCVFVCVSGGIK